MRLSKKNIGGLFDNGGDGSWVYQLIAVNRTHLLFYSFDGKYWKERRNCHYDWRPFVTHPWAKEHIHYGWLSAKEI